jgi:hypothetical protein
MWVLSLNRNAHRPLTIEQQRQQRLQRRYSLALLVSVISPSPLADASRNALNRSARQAIKVEPLQLLKGQFSDRTITIARTFHRRVVDKDKVTIAGQTYITLHAICA